VTLPAEPRFGSPDSYTPKHLAEKILTSKAALEGERKQVTVLFADLKGSMELLGDRDPEEARKLLDPVLERMMEAVHRYEGTVNQVMGDGIMALFGAPLAHEDHAVRACYAALRMQEAVKNYADGVRRVEGVPVRIRVGLNSGEVVVRAIGSDLHMDYTAVGQTTHLAARMEQTADPGSILMTADTLHLAEGFVQVQSLGPVSVKGLLAPVETFSLTGASPVRSRLGAAAARGLTKFVGRDAEMDALFKALEQARGGHGQVVAIVGEPGVGKSRLVWEFTHSHRTQGCLVLEASSVSYGKSSTYLPVIELLKGYFQIEPRDDARKVREKVTGRLLSLDRTLESCLAPICWLLDVPTEDPEWERLDAAARRQRLRDGIRRVLLRESQVQPLVVIFEDLHWIDRETQDLLDGLVERLPTTRALLLANYRPEYSHGWGSKTYYTQVRLDALPSASAEELIHALLGPDPSVTALSPVLITRTEGNPFFLEESIRSLLETGALARERGTYRLLKSPEVLQIQATAQAILAARIDRLGPEDKRLLQTAAVVGKDVPFALLQAIAEKSENSLDAGLARLRTAEFLYETRLYPEAEYTFKHALTHEVTYGGLLQDRRRALHSRIVEAIETLYRDRLGEHTERLAHHALRGELREKAVDYLRQAGGKAAARSALRDARAWFEQALGLLEALPESPAMLEQAFDIRLELRLVLNLLGEGRRQLDCLREAEALAERLNDDSRRGRVCAFMTNIHSFLGELDEALVTGTRALEIAGRLGDLELRILTTSFLEQAHHPRGEYERVVELATDNLGALPADWVYKYFGRPAPASVYDRFYLVMSLASSADSPRRPSAKARRSGLPSRPIIPSPSAWPTKPHPCSTSSRVTGRRRASRSSAGSRCSRPGTSSSRFPERSPPPPGSWRSSASRPRRSVAFMKASKFSSGWRLGDSATSAGSTTRWVEHACCSAASTRRGTWAVAPSNPLSLTPDTRPRRCTCSATSRPIPSGSMPSAARPNTARRWPWPSRAACAPSSPTATSASASSTGALASASRLASTSPPRRRCIARWTCGSGWSRRRRR
jgi:class 3 adenylate cyclase/tetratricopeptide (TPR) repeat protein